MGSTVLGPAAKRTRKQFIKTGQLAAAIAKIYGKKPIMVKDYMKEATKILPRLREMGLAYPRRFVDPRQKSSIIRGVAARIGDHNKALGYSKGVRKFPHKDPQVGAKAAARAMDKVYAPTPKKRTISQAHLQAMIDGGKKARAKKGKGPTPPPRGQVAFIKGKAGTTKLALDIMNILDAYAAERAAGLQVKNNDLENKLKKAESLVARQQAAIKTLEARLADVKSVLSL